MTQPRGVDHLPTPFADVLYAAEPGQDVSHPETMTTSWKKRVDRDPGQGRLCRVNVVASGRNLLPSWVILRATPRFVRQYHARPELVLTVPEPPDTEETPV